MEFHNFLKYLPKIEKVSLPAMDAHLKMAPIERMDALKKLNKDHLTPKIAAVMMLVYPKNGISHIVLIIRNSYPGVHSSQIAFPGGKTELIDKNLAQTALRETEEEVGVRSSSIEVIRPFTEVYIPPSNFMVTPFLGFTETTPKFKLQPEEVAGIIEMPLHELFNDQIVVERKLMTSYAIAVDVPAFKVQEHIVWGATAMMISELKETFRLVW
jgi:8-oxo-dGTP pyrophosphatase MutT (NUDIX family)